MKILSCQQLFQQTIGENDVFLYPTDSLYGLGAIANELNVARIDAIKQRSQGKSYSVIVPSFDRIRKHFIVNNLIISEQWTLWQKYQGPITVLCKRKNPDFMSWISANEYVGLRYIQHPFQKFVSHLGLPFLSTSANISGETYNCSNIKGIFSETVEYFIENRSTMSEKGSTLIHYDSGSVIVRN